MNGQVSGIENQLKEVKNDVKSLKKDVKLLKETTATKKDIEGIPAVKSVIYDIGDKLTEVDSSIIRMELSQ